MLSERNGKMKKYTKTHEWIEVNGTIGRIGITDHAAKSLGGIVFLDYPNVNKVSVGQVIASIESIKAVSEVYTPVSGKLLKTNAALFEDLDSISNNPESTWLVEIEITNPSEIDKLMDINEYLSGL